MQFCKMLRKYRLRMLVFGAPTSAHYLALHGVRYRPGLGSNWGRMVSKRPPALETQREFRPSPPEKHAVPAGRRPGGGALDFSVSYADHHANQNLGGQSVVVQNPREIHQSESRALIVDVFTKKQDPGRFSVPVPVQLYITPWRRPDRLVLVHVGRGCRLPIRNGISIFPSVQYTQLQSRNCKHTDQIQILIINPSFQPSSSPCRRTGGGGGRERPAICWG